MKESLSALLDNEIKVEELDTLLLALKTEPELKASYLSWQIASASLQKRSVFSAGFFTRFAVRLAAEPVVRRPTLSKRTSRRQPIMWGMAASVLLVTFITCYRVGESITDRSIPALQVMSKNEGLNEYVAAHRVMVDGLAVQKDLQYAVYQLRQGNGR